MARNRGGRILLALLTFTICAMAAAPARAQTTTMSKVFSLTVTHDRMTCTSGTGGLQGVTPGTRATATVELRNISKDAQKFGSADVTVPAALVGATKTDGPGELRGNVWSIRDVQVRPTDAVTAKFAFDVPNYEDSFLWEAIVRQSETFAENGNDWTLDNTSVGGDARRTTTSDASCSVNRDCAEDEPCSVTLRHTVRLDESDAVGPASTTVNRDLWVETTVLATPVVNNDGGLIGSDRGTLELVYDAKHTNDDVLGAGCAGYDEPSDLPARFNGPANRDFKVTYTVSEELWKATANTGEPRSCFSAEYLFLGEFDEHPTFEYDEITWFNAFLLPCVPGSLQAAPCVLERNDLTTVDFVPHPVVRVGGPDPMRN